MIATFKLVTKQCITLMVSVGLLNLAVPLRVSAKLATTPTELKLRSASQLGTEAEWYNKALSEIGRISTMKLETSKDLDVANAIIDKHISNLRYHRSKLIVTGLRDATFTSAVKAKAKDTQSTEKFAVELAQNPTSIFRVSGAQSLADRIRRSVDADTAKLGQIASRLKTAAEAIKSKTAGHHAPKTFGTNLDKVTTPQPPDLNTADIAAITVVVAVVVSPPLGLVLLNLANIAVGASLIASGVVVGAALIAGAATLITNLIGNAGTEEGRDKVAACQDEVDRRYRRCVRSAEDLGIFAAAAKTACYADWLLASAACWVS